MNSDLQAAYGKCLRTARSHYENFPVASWLVPKSLRIHVATIYNFARRADDLADEGNAKPEKRIAALELMGKTLDDCLNKRTVDDYLFIALANTIQQHQLEPALFHDLLSAFKQDISKTRYKNFNEVLDYCRRSANPVGRLMLQLFNASTQQNRFDSDNICSALQLINFMQDIQQDLTENNRIYFPQVEMKAAGVTVKDLKHQSTEPHIIAFIHQQVKRARAMMINGASLGKRLNGRFGIEIRATTNNGLHICDTLLKQGNGIYSRPRLTTHTKLRILMRSLY